jgi:hypothetical protein
MTRRWPRTTDNASIRRQMASPLVTGALCGNFCFGIMMPLAMLICS